MFNISMENKLKLIQEFINRSMGDIQEDQRFINRILRFSKTLDGNLTYETREPLVKYSRTFRMDSEASWRLHVADVDIIFEANSYKYFKDEVDFITIDKYTELFNGRRPLIFLDGVKVPDDEVKILLVDNSVLELLFTNDRYGTYNRIDILVVDVSQYHCGTSDIINNPGRHEGIGFYSDGTLVDTFTTVDSLNVTKPKLGVERELYTSGVLNQYRELEDRTKGFFSAFNCVTDNNILVFENNILLSSDRVINHNNTVFEISQFDESNNYRIYVFNKDNRVESHINLSIFRQSSRDIEIFYIENYTLIDSIKNVDTRNFRELYNIDECILMGKTPEEFVDYTLRYLFNNFPSEMSILVPDFIDFGRNSFVNIVLDFNYISNNVVNSTIGDVWGVDIQFDKPRLRIRVKSGRFDVYRNGRLYSRYRVVNSGYNEAFLYLEDYVVNDYISIEYYSDSSVNDPNKDNVIRPEIPSEGEDLVLEVPKDILIKGNYKKEDIYLLFEVPRPVGDEELYIRDEVTGKLYMSTNHFDVSYKDDGNMIIDNILEEFRGRASIVITPPDDKRISGNDILKISETEYMIKGVLPRDVANNPRSYIMLNGKLLTYGEDYIVCNKPILRDGIPYTKIELIKDTTKPPNIDDAIIDPETGEITYPETEDDDDELRFVYSDSRRVPYDKVGHTSDIIQIRDIIPYSHSTHRVWVDGLMVNPETISILNPFTIRVPGSAGKRVVIEAYYSNPDIFDDFKDDYIDKVEFEVEDELSVYARFKILYLLLSGKYRHRASPRGTYIDVHEDIKDLYYDNNVLLDFTCKEGPKIIDSIVLIDLTKYDIELDTIVRPPFSSVINIGNGESSGGIYDEIHKNDLSKLTQKDLDIFFRAVLIDRLMKGEFRESLEDELRGLYLDDTKLRYLYYADNIQLDMTDKDDGEIDTSDIPVLVDFSDVTNYYPPLFPDQRFYEAQIDPNYSYSELHPTERQNLINVYILREMLTYSLINNNVLYSGSLAQRIDRNNLNILFDMSMNRAMYSTQHSNTLLIDMEADSLSFIPEYPDYEMLIARVKNE